MTCQWEQLLSLLPGSMAQEVDRRGRQTLQELRLRLDAPAELNYGSRQEYLNGKVTAEEIAHVINAASRYSPWQAETMARGYLTAQGGHRIGICGQAVCQENSMRGIRSPDSLSIRVARDFEGIASVFWRIQQSLLLLGPPGSGKTTLLRDIARGIARKETVAVVDEREELFPKGVRRGKRMDVLGHCPKLQGIETVLRTMGPDWIAVDEITGEEDCAALIQSANCGVRVLVTAHAWDVRDLHRRSIYRKLLDADIFGNVVVLRKDKSFVWERKEPWM